MCIKPLYEINFKYVDAVVGVRLLISVMDWQGAYQECGAIVRNKECGYRN